MTALLLEWMSFRGHGRRDDIPRKLLGEEHPARVLGDLAVLGHVEADDAANRWRVVPPTLAVLPSAADGVERAVLCGMRTRRVLDRLNSACSRTGAVLSEVSQGRHPPAIMAVAPDVSRFAAEAGIFAQLDAGFTLLACLPRIRTWPRIECPMVVGQVADVKRFSRSQLAWVPSSLEAASAAPKGFFRIKRDWDWVNILKQAPDRQVQIDFHVGRLSVAEKAKVVRWNAATQELRLPWRLFPPTLIARSLVLCSGLIPVSDRERREAVFLDVPGRTLRLALAIMGLRLA